MGGGQGMQSILMLGLMVLVFYFFMIRPQMKKQKELKVTGHIVNSYNTTVNKLENTIIELKNLILQQTLNFNNNNQLNIENETTKINL